MNKNIYCEFQNILSTSPTKQKDKKSTSDLNLHKSAAKHDTDCCCYTLLLFVLLNGLKKVQIV